MQPQPAQNLNSVKVPSVSFAAKYRSKKEIFNFLSVEVKAYLCQYECLTIYFLKDLLSGKKKFVRCDDVHYLFVPQYEQLSVERILERAKQFPRIDSYLPDLIDQHRLPRQWVINIVNTLAGRDFNQWVEYVIQQRNTELANKHDLMIQLEPEIAKAFQASTSISQTKGNGAHLLKVGSKRRRTQAEIMGEQVQEMDQERVILQLQTELQRAKEDALNNLKAYKILEQMIHAGDAKIDESGNVTVIKHRDGIDDSFNI